MEDDIGNHREAAVGSPESIGEREQEEDDIKEEELTEDKENYEAKLIFDDEKELTDEERVQLYEKAMDFKLKKSYKHALLCFLGCIKGIQENTKFKLLPNCLQNIASIYAKFEDFPKAVQFMQAAKLYYETALIGTSTSDEEESYKTMDENAVEVDAKRANEYEKLSHDCLMEKNVQLALEYCGKATQLRRKVYGENHPVTVKSLDLFTMIYAEMGKLQYSDAVKRLDEKGDERTEKQVGTKKVRFADGSKNNDEEDKATEENAVNEDDLSKKTAGLTDTDDEIADTDQKTVSSKFITSKQMVVIFLISSLIAVIATCIFCMYTENESCPSYDYVLERIKFYYYYYILSLYTENKYI